MVTIPGITGSASFYLAWHRTRAFPLLNRLPRCWRGQHIDQMQREQLADPKRLGGYGFSTYSQNDEDGILQEIFRRIGTTNRKFIEFGCGDGLENNTTYLLLSGWRGVWDRRLA